MKSPNHYRSWNRASRIKESLLILLICEWKHRHERAWHKWALVRFLTTAFWPTYYLSILTTAGFCKTTTHQRKWFPIIHGTFGSHLRQRKTDIHKALWTGFLKWPINKARPTNCETVFPIYLNVHNKCTQAPKWYMNTNNALWFHTK